jgi:hypothetical protein
MTMRADEEQCKWCWRIGSNPCPKLSDTSNCQRDEAQRFDGWCAYLEREEEEKAA